MPETRDTKRLPRWAQDLITRAERRAEAAEQMVQATLGNTVSRIEVDPYKLHASKPRCFIPEHQVIRFTLGDGGHIDVRIREGRLYVAAGGFNVLSVRPESSNVVTVGFEPG
jgi:hypothetical protein